MGKPAWKKKIQEGLKQGKFTERNSKAFDEDTAIFINMSQELKEEGNKLFQKRDHEGAMLTYEKALKLLPGNHIDVAYLRSNMAGCYMQLGIGEYPRAINECNLALEVAPKYSKALLKRAKCYEALNRLDLALRDVNTVLSIEPNNLSALEILDSFKTAIEEKGIQVKVPLDYVEPAQNPVSKKIVKERAKKKKSNKFERKSIEEAEEKSMNELEEKKTEDKEVIEEKISVIEKKVVSRSVKLVHGEDIRWAQLPVNCSVRLVRDVIIDRFPNLKGVLIKYKDQDGDLITITTVDELRVAEGLADPEGILRLYIAEVSPDKEPHYEGNMLIEENLLKQSKKAAKVTENVIMEKEPCTIEHWIPQFARIFKNHVGFDSDSCLDLHEIGMKLYSEAMEDSVTSEEAQKLFDISAAQFQEMAALATFNWGNVHLSKARKKIFLSEDNNSAESILLKVKAAYDWAKKEYIEAGMKYEESLKMKPDFYEGLLALGQQLYEQAKLSWYFAIGTKDGDLDIEETAEILELYNKAEDSMEKGMQIWEEMEEQRLNGLSKNESDKSELKKFGLDGLFKDVSDDEASKQAASMRSQIYLLWGTMLYERSVVEYKLTLPTWEECLEVAIEKFELAGALPTDIAVMIKNHCSNDTALEGFKVDEIVQAWNEMYDADRWQTGVASFRLEPLFRRRPPKLHSVLEHL